MSDAMEVIDSSAAAKVFGTFELQEKILIGLFAESGYKSCNFSFRKTSLKAVYRLQRVNTTFKDTITRSKTLRVRMLMEMESRAQDVVANEATRSKWEQHKDMMLSANPLLHSLGDMLSVHLFTVPDYDKSKGIVDLFLSTDEKGSVDERFDSSSSWRGMLLSNQPLYSTAEIHISLGERSCGAHTIVLQELTTLGELVDKMVKIINWERTASWSQRRDRWANGLKW